MTSVPGVLTSGAKVMLVGQAPGREEVKWGRPFCGPAGHELNKWLCRAGLAREVERDGKRFVERGQLAISNVWDREIPAGGVPAMVASTKKAKEEGWLGDGRYGGPGRNQHLRPEWRDGPARLAAEIAQVAPNIIIALGNEALWACSGHFGITDWRGAVMRSRLVTPEGGRREGPKMIATFHPSGILRGGFKNRPLAVADLLKAAQEQATAGLNLPKRELLINPSLHDVCQFTYKHLFGAPYISIDIETAPARREITSIAFAPSPRLAMCIPFVKVTDGSSYWERAEQEVAAWKWVKDICECPVPKVMQNGLYDAQWLWECRRIRVVNYLEDTRLQHHALFPELPKDLGFMGALWENEGSWKMLGARHSEKRDD